MKYTFFSGDSFFLTFSYSAMRVKKSFYHEMTFEITDAAEKYFLMRQGHVIN